MLDGAEAIVTRVYAALQGLPDAANTDHALSQEGFYLCNLTSNL
jgi:hypothetical protein